MCRHSSGVIEVTFRTKRSIIIIQSRQAFTKDNTFKSASFSPYISDVTLKVLTDAAKNYEAITGKEVNVDKTTIANSFKQIVSEDWETLLPIKATLDALNLPCRDFMAEHKQWLDGIQKRCG